ncbi:hypothetical protein CXF29_05810 [Corynebacterium bovis]|nr:hypothetical protein CXF29_05810 [Corynebacterium bovis]
MASFPLIFLTIFRAPGMAGTGPQASAVCSFVPAVRVASLNRPWPGASSPGVHTTFAVGTSFSPLSRNSTV